jgi:hypothetical protein
MTVEIRIERLSLYRKCGRAPAPGTSDRMLYHELSENGYRVVGRTSLPAGCDQVKACGADGRPPH